MELEWLASFGEGPPRNHARVAAARISRWRITPFELFAIDQEIAEHFAQGLLDRNLIPDDEWNDGVILAEASLSGIPLLVTSDKHLLEIDDDALLLEFNQADLPTVRAVHPRRLLRALR